VVTASKSGRKANEVYRDLRSGAESGWDFSSRWLRDGQNLTTIHTTDILPVDLNALLYNLELTIAEIYKAKDEPEYAKSLQILADKRKAIFDKYFWNESAGFYFDYDFVAGKQTEVYSLAAVYPLFFKMATPAQAQKVAELLESKFLQKGGLTTTLNQTNQQWDAPNGFAPLQYLAIQGLRNYGFNDLANKIKQNWVANNLKVYKNTGKMVEKYNVYGFSQKALGGEYPVQEGFGWTNGVLLKLLSEK
jgi:alpha,alpha-trehalase